jgi:hypothetical protein
MPLGLKRTKERRSSIMDNATVVQFGAREGTATSVRGRGIHRILAWETETERDSE